MTRYITGIVILSLCAVLLFANRSEINNDNIAMNTTESTEQQKIDNDNRGIIKTDKVTTNHALQDLECKNCHMCEYPTVFDPCLSPCPRDPAISIYHSPEEGPEIVYMDEVKGDYGPVIFSHKIHAQMSVMSGGCESCHHYNTTGPVLKCQSCHDHSRIREDLSVPDLEGAYHRQCIDCHRQWSQDINCNFCHMEKGGDVEEFRARKMEQYTGMDHPEVLEPDRIVYETDYDMAPLVTFSHNDHAHLFKIDCASCHHDENCITCHDVKDSHLRSPADQDRRLEVHKSFEEHHQPCNDCHATDDCAKCHMNQPMKPFNHASSTGFDLKKHHSDISCAACHKQPDFKGLSSSCQSCHNFESGDFNHDITGFKIDELHQFFDCISCHPKGNYTATPKCTDCHEDMSYPSKKPGRKIK